MRAMLKLFEYQTENEKRSERTISNNNVGPYEGQVGYQNNYFSNMVTMKTPRSSKDEIRRDYFNNELFREEEKIIEDTKITYIFSDILTDNIHDYYSRLKWEEID